MFQFARSVGLARVVVLLHLSELLGLLLLEELFILLADVRLELPFVLASELGRGIVIGSGRWQSRGKTGQAAREAHAKNKAFHGDSPV
jgi:hypothetical protein